MDAPSQEVCKSSLAAEVLQSTGTLQLRASGVSMLPTLWPGDCITIQSYNFDQAQPGDVVLYARSGRLFIHRVMRKCRLGEERMLITRGDCMGEDDPPVQEKDLLGKITAIHRRNTRIVPGRKVSPARLLTAWLLCHWSLLLRATLRVHANFEWAFDRSRG
jgi:signal peptidase I